MVNVKHLCTALNRYHRSGGHGIHSPFAFKFVLDVLREKCAYYAYEDIQELRRKAKKLLKRKKEQKVEIVSDDDARMIFRIANYYNPQRFLEIGSCYGIVSSVMMMVSSKSEVVRYEPLPEEYEMPDKPGFPTGPRLKYFDNFEKALETFGEQENPFVMINHVEQVDYEKVSAFVDGIQKNGGVIILRNISRNALMRDLWQQIVNGGKFGMGFSNDKIAVFAGSKKLPRQNFSLWF